MNVMTDWYRQMTWLYRSPLYPWLMQRPFLDNCFILYWIPPDVQTENAPQLMSNILATAVACLSSEHMETTAYHHRTTGKSSTLKNIAVRLLHCAARITTVRTTTDVPLQWVSSLDHGNDALSLCTMSSANMPINPKPGHTNPDNITLPASPVFFLNCARSSAGYTQQANARQTEDCSGSTQAKFQQNYPLHATIPTTSTLCLCQAVRTDDWIKRLVRFKRMNP